MSDPIAELDLYGWAPDTSVAGAGWSELTPAEQAAALAWSVGVLWALSGRRFELHTHRVAPFIPPARPNAYSQRNRYAPLAVNYRAGYVRLGGCAANTFRLPAPVHDVTQVQIDGVVLPAENWNLDPDGTLVRTDGAGWPVGQDVYAARWLVDYVLGTPVPAAGNTAAGRYAGELARAAKGQRCSLPAKARNVARPGLTMELRDPAELTENGRTGNDAVDAWLASVNPAGLTSEPTVYSPDLAVHRFLS